MMGGAASRVACVVDAYNPEQHTVKVRRQPEDELTGWVQIETPQVGFMAAPNIGDPGWLEFHGDDYNAPVFVGSNHNDLFPPPQQIAAGELFYKNKSGSSLYFKKDGSVTATDKAGASWTLDGSGNFTIMLPSGGKISVSGGNGGSLSVDGSGNVLVVPALGGNVFLGGSGGSAEAIARNGDSVVGGVIVASSGNVKST